MLTIGGIASGIKRRIIERRLPYTVTLRDLEPAGVMFEVGSLVEYFRVVQHGGEFDYTVAMLADLRKDDVLFDIGANLGLVAVHAAGICDVVAFEPDPAIRLRLENNRGLNPARPFSIEPCAVSDVNEAVVLHTDADRGTSPSLVRQRGERDSVSVPGRTLDSLIAEGRLPHPTVLKLDIEGAEVLALRGAARLLAGPERPRALYIEVHNGFLPAFGSSAREVHSLLEEHGYTKEVYRNERGDQTHLIVHSDGASISR